MYGNTDPQEYFFKETIFQSMIEWLSDVLAWHCNQIAGIYVTEERDHCHQLVASIFRLTIVRRLYIILDACQEFD
jgi:hypothetical protein